MAIRVDGWKMHIGVKQDGSWWNEKYYPSVPYIFNLLMDPMEKMDPRVARVGLHRPQVLRLEAVGADRRRALHRGTSEEPGHIRHARRRHPEHEEEHRAGDGEDGVTARQQQLAEMDRADRSARNGRRKSVTPPDDRILKGAYKFPDPVKAN